VVHEDGAQLNAEVSLNSPETILWEVDVQADFMLPGGKLYVLGAEEIVVNVSTLVDIAREGRAFLVSSADAHDPDDPELRHWPPHCLKGTSGADLLNEACASPRLIVPNQKGFALPQDVRTYRQVTLEKNTLDVFNNPNTDVLLNSIVTASLSAFGVGPQFFVFGVATEYCVRSTVEGLLRRGHLVAIVTDAVRPINQEKGQQVLDSLRFEGARLTATRETLALVGGAS